MVTAVVGANWEMKEKARLLICLQRKQILLSVFRVVQMQDILS